MFDLDQADTDIQLCECMYTLGAVEPGPNFNQLGLVRPRSTLMHPLFLMESDGSKF